MRYTIRHGTDNKWHIWDEEKRIAAPHRPYAFRKTAEEVAEMMSRHDDKDRAPIA